MYNKKIDYVAVKDMFHCLNIKRMYRFETLIAYHPCPPTLRDYSLNYCNELGHFNNAPITFNCVNKSCKIKTLLNSV